MIYEINTWVWLEDLSRIAMRPITLADVPEEAWDHLASRAIDAVWLMGVWERSPAGAEVMRSNAELTRACADLLVSFTPGDLVGSPYCIRRYVPDDRLGGLAGLLVARRRLAERGLKLLLDYVPNHIAPDHAWVAEHPDYLIHGDRADLDQHPDQFTDMGATTGVVAFGRDPFSAPWTDVIQINTFSPGVRTATVELLSTVAEWCDGVRCDMAMLAITEIFRQTWGERAGAEPGEEYWSELTGAVRAQHPEFLFVAETYWDREWQLLQQGFDYCYDKVLYDRVSRGDAPAVRGHLGADLSYQRQLVRFLENHDEDRVVAAMGPEAARAAAVALATLPGASLYFDGQFDGFRVRLPVALGRRPDEPSNEALEAFYRRLLAVAREVRHGEWRLVGLSGWPDNDSQRHIVAWTWVTEDATVLVAVNLSGESVDGIAWLPLRALPDVAVDMTDLLSGETFERDPIELRDRGLYIRLGPHGFHVLRTPL